MVYLESNPAYSDLVQALEKAELASKLNLYGTMTLFAPTNDAFKKFFDRRGITDISQIDPAELEKILLYHLYAKTYVSANFISGSLSSTTVEGDFIQMDISEGVRKTVLNGTVHVDSLDIPVTNGVVHVVDDVLEPPTQTLYEWLKTQPAYSIMLEAFEKTGNADEILNQIVYDPLNTNFGKPAIKWRTLFLETNEVLRSKGISSFNDLVQKYSNTGNYTDEADSLNIFVRYHCLEKKTFLSDLRNDYFETFKPGAYLIFNITSGITINKREKKSLVYNPETGMEEIVTTNVYVGLDQDQSNKVTRNGILHSVNTLLELYDPPAVELIMKFAGDPNDRNIVLPSGETVNITGATVFNDLNNDEVSQSAVWWLKWGGSMTGVITADWPSNTFGDYSCVVQKNDGEYWLEITTKPVFKGNYKVYVTYRRTTNTNYFVQFYWDGEKLGDLTDLTKSPDAFGNTLGGTDTKVVRQVGLLKLTEMAPHKFKLYLPNPGTNYTAWYTLEMRPI
jgi:uncharacterized surface protein with fasciclin (FAS1) repeats